MRVLAIILAVVLCASTAQASEPIKSIPPGDDVIVVLNKNEKAPFSGQLYSYGTALRWGNWLSQYKLRLEIDVEAEKKACEIQLSYSRRLYDAEEERNQRVETDLRSRLQKAEGARLVAEERARNPPFYETFTFGFVVGLVVTGGIGAVVVWGLN